jgi:aspartyl-tRNA(Asn)/glutamyl-tRNA(Gln) amidotransferase subunit B
MTNGDWELVIGLETHIQLQTRSKMFCPCAADYEGAEPNTHVCPVCLGLPGTLPVPNAEAVAQTVRLGLALGCLVHPDTHWDRKNYHYPDLPKGYQITQHHAPLCTGGDVEVDDGAGGRRRVRLERAHLEEDTGKLTHVGDATWVDYNRAGVPLLEVVTLPDLRSPDEAKAYVEALRWVLRWLGVSTGNMESGALRVDVNVSVRRPGEAALGTKVELKNLNSLAAVKSALEFERERLIGLVSSGQPVAQETRGWQEAAGRTVSQRSKESAHDYRYFPEPDLPPLAFSADWVSALQAAQAELPWARRDRFTRQYDLTPDSARLLTRDRETSDYFEASVAAYDGTPGQLAPWVIGALFGLMNAANQDMADAAATVPPRHLAELVALVDAGSLSGSAAKEVLATMHAGGEPAAAIVAREGLGLITDDSTLAAVISEVIAANPRAVADYQSGKANAVAFLVGGVMKATRGQADPNLAKALLLAALEQLPVPEDTA